MSDLNDEQKHQHDQATSMSRQKWTQVADTALMQQGLATILYVLAQHDKYNLPPADVAVMGELFHRADPSSGW